MSDSKFFLQVAHTESSGWILALRSNKPEILEENSQKIADIGFRKSKKGNYILVGMDADENGIVLPDGLKNLLSESAHTAFQSDDRWLPWVEIKDQPIRFTKFIKSPGSKPVVLVHAGENAAVQYGHILREVGFSISPSGVVYLAKSEGGGFDSHSQMVAELSLRARALSVRLGGIESEALVTLRSVQEVFNKNLPVQYPTFFTIPSLIKRIEPTPESRPQKLVLKDFDAIESHAIVAAGKEDRVLFKADWNFNIGGIPPIVTTLDKGKLVELAVYTSNPEVSRFDILETYRFDNKGSLITAVTDYPNMGELELSREAAVLQWGVMLQNIKQCMSKSKVKAIPSSDISEALIKEYADYPVPNLDFTINDEFKGLAGSPIVKTVDELVAGEARVTEQMRAEADPLCLNIFGENVYVDDENDKYVENNDGEKVYSDLDSNATTNAVRFLEMSPGENVPALVAVAIAIGFANNGEYSGVKDVIYDGGTVPEELGKLVSLANDFSDSNAMTMDVVLPADLSKDKQLESLNNIVSEHIKSAGIKHGSAWVKEMYGRNILTDVVENPKQAQKKPVMISSSSLFERIKHQFDEESLSAGNVLSGERSKTKLEDVVSEMVSGDLLAGGLLDSYPGLYQYLEQLETIGRIPLAEEDKEYFLGQLSAMEVKIQDLGLFKASELLKEESPLAVAEEANIITNNQENDLDEVTIDKVDSGAEMLEGIVKDNELNLEWLSPNAHESEINKLSEIVKAEKVARIFHKGSTEFLYGHIAKDGKVAVLTDNFKVVNTYGSASITNNIKTCQTGDKDKLNKAVLWGERWSTGKYQNQSSGIKHEHANGEVKNWPLRVGEYHLAREFFDTRKGESDWADTISYVSPKHFDESSFSITVTSVGDQYKYKCYSPFGRELIQGEQPDLDEAIFDDINNQVDVSKVAAKALLEEVVSSFAKAGFEPEADVKEWLADPDFWNDYDFVKEQSDYSVLRASTDSLEGFVSGKPVSVSVRSVFDTGTKNESQPVADFELDKPSDIFEKLNTMALANDGENEHALGTIDHPYQFDLSYADYKDLKEVVAKDVVEEVTGLPEGSRRHVVINRTESNGTVVKIYSAVIANEQGEAVIVSKPIPHYKHPLTDADVDALYEAIPAEEGKLSLEKVVEEERSTPDHSMPNGQLEVVVGEFVLKSISPKAFVVTGETKPHKDKLNKNGARGIFKPDFKGWMFPKSRYEEILTIVEGMNAVPAIEEKLDSEGETNDRQYGERNDNALENVPASENGLFNEGGRAGEFEGHGISGSGNSTERNGQAGGEGREYAGSRVDDEGAVLDSSTGKIESDRRVVVEKSLLTAPYKAAEKDSSDNDGDVLRGARPSIDDAKIVGKGYLYGNHLVNFAYKENHNQVIIVKSTNRGLVNVLGLNDKGKLIVVDNNGVRGRYETPSIIVNEKVTVHPYGKPKITSLYLEENNLDFMVHHDVKLKDISFVPFSFQLDSEFFGLDSSKKSFFDQEVAQFTDMLKSADKSDAREAMLSGIKQGKTFYDFVSENYNREGAEIFGESPLFNYAVSANGFPRYLANELDDLYRSVMAEHIVENHGHPAKWAMERAQEIGGKVDSANELIISAYHIQEKLLEYKNDEGTLKPLVQIAVRIGSGKFIALDTDILTGQSWLTEKEVANKASLELILNKTDLTLEGAIPSKLAETIFTEENLDTYPEITEFHEIYIAKAKAAESLLKSEQASFFEAFEVDAEELVPVSTMPGTPIEVAGGEAVQKNVFDITSGFEEGELENGILLLSGNQKESKLADVVERSGGVAKVIASVAAEKLGKAPREIFMQVQDFIKTHDPLEFIDPMKIDWIDNVLPSHIKSAMDRNWIMDAIATEIDRKSVDRSHVAYIEIVESRLNDIREVLNRRVEQEKATIRDIEQSSALIKDIDYIGENKNEIIDAIVNLQELPEKKSSFTRLGESLWGGVNKKGAEAGVFNNTAPYLAASTIAKADVNGLLGNLVDSLVGGAKQLGMIVEDVKQGQNLDLFKITETYPLGLNYEKPLPKEFIRNVGAIFEKYGITKEYAAEAGIVSLIMTDPDYDSNGGFATNEIGFNSNGDIEYLTEFFMEGHRRTDGETFNIQFDQGTIEMNGRRDPITSDRDFPSLALRNVANYLSMGAYEVRVDDKEPKIYTGNPDDQLQDVPDVKENDVDANPLTQWVNNYDEYAIADKLVSHDIGDETEILTAEISKGGNQLHRLEKVTSHNLTLTLVNEEGVVSDVKIASYESVFGLSRDNGDKLRTLVEDRLARKLEVAPRPTTVLQSLPTMVLIRESTYNNPKDDFNSIPGSYETYSVGKMNNAPVEDGDTYQSVIIRPRKPLLFTSENGVINLKQIESILDSGVAREIQSSKELSISVNGDIKVEDVLKSNTLYARASLDKKHDALVINNLDSDHNPVVVVPFSDDYIYQIPMISSVRETEKQSSKDIGMLAREIVEATTHEELDNILGHLMNTWASSIEGGVSTNKHLDAYLLAQAAMGFKESLGTAGLLESKKINFLQASILVLLKDGVHPKHIDSHVKSYGFKGYDVEVAFHDLAESGYIASSDSDIFNYKVGAQEKLLTKKADQLIDLLPAESAFWHLENIAEYNKLGADRSQKEIAEDLIQGVLSGRIISDPIGDYEKSEEERYKKESPIKHIIEGEIMGAKLAPKYKLPKKEVVVEIDPALIEDALSFIDDSDVIEVREYIENHKSAAIKLIQATDEIEPLDEPIVKSIIQGAKAYAAIDSGRYTLNDVVDLGMAYWVHEEPGGLFKTENEYDMNMFIPQNDEAYVAFKEVLISQLVTHENLKQFDSSSKAIDLGLNADYKLSTLNVLTSNSLHTFDSVDGRLIIAKSANGKLRSAAFMDGRGRITATALKEYRENPEYEDKLEINPRLAKIIKSAFDLELKELVGIKDAPELVGNIEFDLEESKTGGEKELFEPKIVNNVAEIEKGMAGGITPLALFNRNIDAIKTVKELERSGREATSEERIILAGYVGWGGLAAAFQKPSGDYTKGWEERAVKLEQLMSTEEYESARSSTNSSFYTNAEMIKPMYDGLRRMGVSAGQKWLEPSAGTGNFFGLMPPAMERDSVRVGIELDSISSRIAAKLYQNTSTKIIKETGFQKYRLEDNRFDVVVGNPPFGDVKLYDAINPRYNGMPIHSYFINKSLKGTRSGGIMAVVVSRYLMDKLSPKDRMEIAKQADLVGAFRLPETAFKSANTKAVADILFLQRSDRYAEWENDPDKVGEFEYPSWVTSTKMDIYDEKEEELAKIPVNNYFQENPEHVIGHFSIEDGMIKRGLTVLPPEGFSWESSLNNAIKSLPENIYENKQQFNLGNGDEIYNDYGEVLVIGEEKLPAKVSNQAPDGLFFDSRYGVLRKEHDVDGEVSASIVSKKMLSSGKMADMKGKDLERLTGLVKMRELLDDLLLSEQVEADKSSKTEGIRKELNRSYDSFVNKYGYVNSGANKGVFRQDPSWVRVSALENYTPAVSATKAEKTNNVARSESAEKMAIFNERLFVPGENKLTASSPIEAMVVSLSTKGVIDLEMMSNMIEMPKEQLVSELNGEMFLDPESLEWVHKDIYLSGNVKAKYKIADRESFDNPVFKDNAEHLKRSFPEDVAPEDILIGFGASWLPKDVYVDFIRSLAGSDVSVEVRYIEAKAEWIFKGTENPALRQDYCTEKNSIYKTLSRIASNSPLNCYKLGADGERVIDGPETESVNQIAVSVLKQWNEWLQSNTERLDKIAKIYNEKINVSIDSKIKAPESFEIVGKVPDSVIELRQHQKDYVWRRILKKDNSAIHDTGAGKTFAEVAALLTVRRLGLTKKPILAVPNHLTGSWTRAFYALYPHAKILSPAKSDFSRENRQKLFAKIATGDWDCVVIAHSQLERLPIDHDMAQQFIKDEISDITKSISGADKEDRITIKKLESIKTKLQEKLEKTISNSEKDKGISWKMLNCDSLSVDESHNYKNLGYATSLTVSGLGSTTGSNKAFDYYVKAQSIRKNGGRVSDLTATPISNTIAEMYTYLRYKSPERLKDMGLSHFDAWVRQFAEVTSEYELDATGVKYRLNQRLSKFKNVPELMTLYREVSHIVTTEDIRADYDRRGKSWIIPEMVGGKPENVVVPRTKLMADYMFDIIERANDVENGIVEKTEDNKLKITTDARKAAIDMRLIDDTFIDEEETKVDVAIKNAADTYQEWNDQKGTQLIFCDLGVPKAAKGDEKEILIEIMERARSEDPAVADKATKLLEGYSYDEVDAIMTTNSFSVYDYMRDELVTKFGISAHEIAFIHDAKTDEARVQLFDDMNKGRKRILIGSTRKMGEGMNVQERLVWQHEIDCPWRPDQVQQRRGRIDRQGNKLFEANPDFKIGISRYATENTYDSRMWQTVETKARFIGQIRSGYVTDRIVDDITPEAAGAAEMKAAASGNPAILREFILRKKIKDLEVDLRQLSRKSNQYHRDVEGYRRDAKLNATKIDLMNDVIATASAYPDKVTVNIDGRSKQVMALSYEAEGRDKIVAAKDTAAAVLIDIARKLKAYNTGMNVEFDLGTLNGCALGFDTYDMQGRVEDVLIEIRSPTGKVVNSSRVSDVLAKTPTGMATILRNLVDPEFMALETKRCSRALEYYNKSVSDMETMGPPCDPVDLKNEISGLRVEHAELLKTVLSGAAAISATTKDIEKALEEVSALRDSKMDQCEKFMGLYDEAMRFFRTEYPKAELYERGDGGENEAKLATLEDVNRKVERLVVVKRMESLRISLANKGPDLVDDAEIKEVDICIENNKAEKEESAMAFTK